MPTYAQAYREAVNAARRAAMTDRGLPIRAVQELYEEYAEFIAQIQREVASEAITAERGESLIRIISDNMRDLSSALSDIFDAEQGRMIDLAISGHKNGVAEAAKLTGASMKVNFDGVPTKAIEQMMKRRGFVSSVNFKTVMRRNLANATRDIDRFITSVVARGVSARRASLELAGIMVQNDDRLVRVLKDGRLMKSEINKALKEGQINLAEFKRARTTLYDARRIIVTETNTAFREADLISAQESPVVGFKRWVVSSRHYGLPSTPDVCTLWHEEDLFGHGAGIFPIQNFPSPPHPFCGCRGEDVFRDPSQWGREKVKAKQPPTLRVNQVANLFSGKTENHINRQVELSNEMLAHAYDAL